ncbi:MAG: methyltransferase domain-containing protein [Spirochaetaceae bacterium]|nr:MAG: methyltransferase domain-containing protein [Spirochaetaceae bacterium]
MKVILVPSIRASMGSGHLKRARRLAQIFGPQTRILLEEADRVLGANAAAASSDAAAAGSDGAAPGSGPARLQVALQALLEPLGIPPSRVLGHYDPQEPWDLVIVDRQRSQAQQVLRFFPAPVIGLDEGGPARRFCSYLIDTLPVVRQPHRANLSALSLLDLADSRSSGRRAGKRQPPQRRLPQCRLPAQRRFPEQYRLLEQRSRPQSPISRVLVSFGGEDPADLSTALLDLLLENRVFDPEQITVVQGPYFRRNSWPEGVAVLRSPAELKTLLSAYDLLFCSFGLTAYEALAAAVPVINLNPSRYHRRLSRAAGIPEIGVRRPAIRRLRALLDEPGVFEDLLSRYPPETFSESPQLSKLPALLQASGGSQCPVCGRTDNPATARFTERSYFRCLNCGILYLIAFGQRNVQGIRYGGEYFFSEYRKQYGKTYLEDFQTIKGMAAARLKQIRALTKPAQARADSTAPARSPAPATGAAAEPARNPATVAGAARQPVTSGSDPRLLDVGCAYGPFLQAAAEQGYRVQGLDISEEAVSYVRDRLGIPCRVGDFSAAEDTPELAGEQEKFDVITMWYVVEHFRDTAEVLGRVNRLLRPGGVFAFSTPSASGISARKNGNRFLQNSPQDHYTVWPLGSVSGILGRFGFRLKQIVVTGHHGERFPWPGELSSKSVIAAGFSVLSRMLRLGDTFEAYALKVRQLQ